MMCCSSACVYVTLGLVSVWWFWAWLPELPALELGAFELPSPELSPAWTRWGTRIGAFAAATLALQACARAAPARAERAARAPPMPVERGAPPDAQPHAEPPPGAALAALGAARGVPFRQWLKLLLCVALDACGDLSYLLPGLGELGDLAWAPTSAALLRELFGSNAIASIDFVKEALPFSDVLPVATCAWALQTFAPGSWVAWALGVQPHAAAAAEGASARWR